MDLLAPTHLLVLLLVLFVIFGFSRLGDLGGALGKGIRDSSAQSMIRKPSPLCQQRYLTKARQMRLRA